MNREQFEDVYKDTSSKQLRDIKFRAWDKKHKEMIPDLLCFYKDGSISHNNHFNSDTQPFRGYMWNSRDLEIMQYTGLKDKNGVEIYEGDILKCFGDIAEVYYDNECALFRYKYYSDKETYMEILGTHSYEYFEVIGNIYENPELLHVKE